MRYFFAVSLLLLSACQSVPTAQTAPEGKPAAPLRETRWVLRQLPTGPVHNADDAREAYLLLRPTGRAEGHASCNRFGGEFTAAEAGQLRFGALFSTRMACLDSTANVTETRFLGALNDTRRYRISGDTLRLYDATEQELARLEAVYL